MLRPALGVQAIRPSAHLASGNWPGKQTGQCGQDVGQIRGKPKAGNRFAWACKASQLGIHTPPRRDGWSMAILSGARGGLKKPMSNYLRGSEFDVHKSVTASCVDHRSQNLRSSRPGVRRACSSEPIRGARSRGLRAVSCGSSWKRFAAGISHG